MDIGLRIMESIPLYNSIIIKTYVDYLENAYPTLNIEQLLACSAITNYELEDKGHWLTQEQVNRFQAYVEQATANPNIAREAGRNIASNKSSRLLRQSAAAFISPATAYWAMEKLGSTISRHQTMKITKIKDNAIEIAATPLNYVKEELFQCENRLGMFEAVAEVFTHKFAHVEHPECIHRGGKSCRYIITWDNQPSLIWKRTGTYLSILSLIAMIPAFFLLSFTHWIIFVLFVLLISTGILLYGHILNTKEITNILEEQGKASDQLVEQINLRYNESLLIREIGEAASNILEPQELLYFITDALQKRLQFNRGMIMLVNPAKTKLVYAAGYGFSREDENLLKNTSFNITNPQSKGAFYLSYRDQKPLLISNTDDIANDLSEKSTIIIKKLAIKAFICVPIIYEGKTEGILAIDNSKLNKQPTQSDLSLLMGIAPQIGISMNNARAHKKLKESEERFRNLTDNSPDIIYQLNLDGIFTYVNPAWHHTLGHSSNELLGKSFVTLLPDNDQAIFVNILKDIIDTKLTVRDQSFIILSRKGLPRHITFTGAPDLDAEGNVIGIVGTLKDITKFRSMETQLLQASKMEAIGTLTGGIAHDFNNIIQAIMGYNQLMLSERNGDEIDTIYLKSIAELTQRSRELVRQLLLFSKKVDPLSKAVNINDEIRSMNNLLAKSIPKMIEIKINLDDDVSLINADSDQIGQIIMNLVINARDAIGESGTIVITTNNLALGANKIISGINVPAGNYVELAVSDNGCGIEKQNAQRIFEPFFTTKEVGKGTGLGLAVVYGIVKNHGGFIFCESKLDKGTTFRIMFPSSAAARAAKASEIIPRTIPTGKETLLLVDDEKSILETVRDTLSIYGYKILTAETGEQAIEIYHSKKGKIKLVILDLIMPGMGGKKCLIDLLAINPQAKVLMTSGYSSSQQIDELNSMGACGFINKPYRSEDLLIKIREIIDTAPQPTTGRTPLQISKGV
jgi:PAS domain S-box-containing protein